MTSEAWSRRSPWIALPVVAVLSFGLGGWLLGGPDPAVEDHAAHAHGADVVWTCSMHPQIRQPEAGQCPICGMDLIPATSGDSTDGDRPERVRLSERAKVLARIRTVAVSRMPSPSVDVRLLGRVDYDESLRRDVTAWTGGRIDRLHVRTTGEQVRRGQTIATLYSPEVYAAHQDLLTARRQVERLSAGSDIARTAAEAALSAARQRLALLGVPQREVDQLAAAPRPTDRVGIRSPFAGTVLERVATEGAYVQTGTVLYRIADLSRVWVQLEAYERDLPSLSVGQTVALELEALPGERFDGAVTFIDPTLDARRRVTRVRVEVDNADGRLRPGMFAEAIVRGSLGGERPRPLTVPASAPLFTGRRSVVFVEVPGQDRPTYDARVVRLGPRMGELYPVVAGLADGDRVVVHGAFTLDADLQIRGGASMMAMPDDTARGAYDDVIEVPEELLAGLAPIVAAYLDLAQALAADDLDAARESARQLLAAEASFRPEEPRDAVDAWRGLAHRVRGHATEIVEAAGIEAMRGAFESLTEQIAELLRRFGNPLPEPVRLAYCPMAAGNEGAEWFQRGERIDNAYFGEMMRTCGEVRLTLEPGSYLTTSPAPARAPSPAAGHAH